MVSLLDLVVVGSINRSLLVVRVSVDDGPGLFLLLNPWCDVRKKSRAVVLVCVCLRHHLRPRAERFVMCGRSGNKLWSCLLGWREEWSRTWRCFVCFVYWKWYDVDDVFLPVWRAALP